MHHFYYKKIKIYTKKEKNEKLNKRRKESNYFELSTFSASVNNRNDGIQNNTMNAIPVSLWIRWK